MKNSLLIIVLSSFALLGSNAKSLTIKEKKEFQEWQNYLNDGTASAKNKVMTNCGFDIPISLDEKLVTPFMKDQANAASYCDEARSTIATMCEEATSKSAIKSKIKKINCNLNKKEDDTLLTISGDTLNFTIGTKSSNLTDKVKEFLENNL